MSDKNIQDKLNMISSNLDTVDYLAGVYAVAGIISKPLSNALMAIQAIVMTLNATACIMDENEKERRNNNG